MRLSFASACLAAALVAATLGFSPAAQAGDEVPALTSYANASSASGIGSGRALVRVDAPHARAKRVDDRTFKLVVPSGSVGQWMGERSDKRGVVRLRTGSLTAKGLARNWKRLKYTSTGVRATLVWEEAGQRNSALVRISHPKVAGSAVTFAVQAGPRGLPTTFTNLSINVRRAPVVQTRSIQPTRSPRSSSFVPFSETDPLTDDLFFSTAVQDDGFVANNMLYDSAHPSGCWSANIGGDTLQWEWEIYPPDMNCGGVSLTQNSFRANLPNSNEVAVDPETGEYDDFITQFSTVITPPGEASMKWWDYIACWDEYGEVEYC